MANLLDKRLIVVTGKGGVGKTTVAAALGLVAARRGKRTIVCEVAEQERLPGMFGLEAGGHDERELAPGLHGISVAPERAKQEWLQYQLKSSTLAGVLGGSRVFQYLTAAAPGLDDLVTIGKVWDMAQLRRRTGEEVYDLSIVDAPATGHGLAMLGAPRTYAEVARVGPIRRQALTIHTFLTDPKSTGVLLVALPEEMPVTETVEFERRLGDELDMGVDGIVVNALYPQRFSAADVRRMSDLDGRASPEAASALGAAVAEHHRARGQRSQLRRLRRAASAPVMTLPYVFEPELGVPDLERLSRELERRV
jgi:anion-transporting  ArsA/GET3 family ATPase